MVLWMWWWDGGGLGWFGPDQEDGAGCVVDGEEGGRAEAFRSWVGAVPVAGEDE